MSKDHPHSQGWNLQFRQWQQCGGRAVSKVIYKSAGGESESAWDILLCFSHQAAVIWFLTRSHTTYFRLRETQTGMTSWRAEVSNFQGWPRITLFLPPPSRYECAHCLFLISSSPASRTRYSASAQLWKTLARLQFKTQFVNNKRIVHACKGFGNSRRGEMLLSQRVSSTINLNDNFHSWCCF